jgi:hypothetical protein
MDYAASRNGGRRDNFTHKYRLAVRLCFLYLFSNVELIITDPIGNVSYIVSKKIVFLQIQWPSVL